LDHHAVCGMGRSAVRRQPARSQPVPGEPMKRVFAGPQILAKGDGFHGLGSARALACGTSAPSPTAPFESYRITIEWLRRNANVRRGLGKQLFAPPTAPQILARRQNRPARRRSHASAARRSSGCASNSDKGGAGLWPAAACVLRAAGQDGQEDWRQSVKLRGGLVVTMEPAVFAAIMRPFEDEPS